MKPIKPAANLFAAREVTFGEGQPEYQPLPALVQPDGTLTTEWQLSEEDIDRIMRKGADRIRLTLKFHVTPDQPISPQLLEVVGES